MSDMDNVLIVADSERDANMLYAVGMFAPDPFIYFRVDGKSHIVVSDLEMGRARKQAPHCRVISHSQCVERLRRDGVKKASLAAVAAMLLREHGAKKVFAPANFPLGLAKELRDHKVKVRVKKGGLFPQREFKRADEVKKISNAAIINGGSRFVRGASGFEELEDRQGR